jgi:hypothetical protein
VDVGVKKEEEKEQMPLTCSYVGNFNVLRRQLVTENVNCKFLKH